MSDEVLDTTLYLLHKKSQSPASRAFPNITPANVANISNSIRKRRHDPKLADIIKKRNYYTQKVYQYINDSYESENASRIEANDARQVTKPEVPAEPRASLQDEKGHEKSHLGTPQPTNVINLPVEPVKITSASQAIHYISENILSKTDKRSEIDMYVREQRDLQLQWSSEREEIKQSSLDAADEYQQKMYRSMEGYHPSKLGHIRQEMESRIQEMELELEENLRDFDEKVYAKCVDINNKIVRNLKYLKVPLFHHDRSVKVDKAEQEKVLDYLRLCSDTN